MRDLCSRANALTIHSYSLNLNKGRKSLLKAARTARRLLTMLVKAGRPRAVGVLRDSGACRYFLNYMRRTSLQIMDWPYSGMPGRSTVSQLAMLSI